jgi:hypothetical protein
MNLMDLSSRPVSRKSITQWLLAARDGVCGLGRRKWHNSAKID